MLPSCSTLSLFLPSASFTLRCTKHANGFRPLLEGSDSGELQGCNKLNKGSGGVVVRVLDEDLGD